VGRAIFSKRATWIDTEVIGGNSDRFDVDVSTGTQRWWFILAGPYDMMGLKVLTDFVECEATWSTVVA
jgi:hypothetical protein